MKKLLLVITYNLFAAFNIVVAQGGPLDLTFDADGIVFTTTGTFGEANSVAIQPDGKIVVAGTSNMIDVGSFTLTRYNTNGDLDLDFGTDGIVSTFIGVGGGKVSSVAIQMDGKIVVVGSYYNFDHWDLALTRYNADGSLDLSFGTDGIVVTPLGTSDEMGLSSALQTDGKIVVGGFISNGIGDDFAVTRFNTDGSLDLSFGTDGFVITSFGTYDDWAESVAIQSDGKIVAAGWTLTGFDFALSRYNTDGSLDLTFDTDGMVTTNFGAYFGAAKSVAIQADGKIVAAGKTGHDGIPVFALTRYNTDGSLDLTFDTDGIVITTIGDVDNMLNSVILQWDGKIVAAGYSNDGPTTDFTLTRYNTDGSLDLTFDTDGKVTTNIGTGESVANSLKMQADGKIVVAGTSQNGASSRFTVVRYDNGTALGINTNGEQNTEINFYPNPATEKLNISLAENEESQLQIFNSMGMLVKEISITQTSQINISDLSNGLYFMYLTSDGKIIATEKLIITD